MVKQRYTVHKFTRTHLSVRIELCNLIKLLMHLLGFRFWWRSVIVRRPGRSLIAGIDSRGLPLQFTIWLIFLLWSIFMFIYFYNYDRFIYFYYILNCLYFIACLYLYCINIFVCFSVISHILYATKLQPREKGCKCI